MSISTTSIFRGPSVYSRHSVAHFTLDRIEPWPEQGARRLLADLFERLPGLLDHSMRCRAPRCFETLRVGDRIQISHLFEHVCIELQKLAGAELSCVRADGFRRAALDGATVPYEEAEVCLEAARWTDDFFTHALARDDALAVDFAARLEQFIAFVVQTMLPVQDRTLIKTARSLDVPVARLAGRIIVLGQGCRQQRLGATKTTMTNVVSNDLAANKDYTRRLLGDLGLPIPRYERVYRGRDAVEAGRRIGFPVVVKPNNGSMGRGVSIGLERRRDVRAAYERARERGRSVLVEEMVEGSDYRMLVINGKLCAASKRVPAHVVGDGRHTIEELVAEVNKDPRRGTGANCSWTRIELDDRADRLIADAGYTRQSIPADGEWIYLRRNANTSDGGTAVDVTDDVHPDNRAIAVSAARAIGLDIAGVDILTRDISTSMLENGGKVCEINSRPGIRKHLWPAEGTPRDVTTPIVKMLFPADRSSRIPIVAMIGTGDVALAAQMLADILTLGGRHVGIATRRHVCSGARVTAHGGLTAPDAARRLLLDPEVTVAVLEITPEDASVHGLGCDAYDLALIVNAEASAGNAQPSELPAAMLDAIRVVAGITRGAVVIDADDASARVITDNCGDARICRVAVQNTAHTGSACSSDDVVPVVLEHAATASPTGDGSPLRIPIADLVARHSSADADSVIRSAVFAGVAAHRLGEEPVAIYRRLAGQS